MENKPTYPGSLGRNANGEPLCLGSDWTAKPFTPSSLTGPVDIGGCSYLSTYDEYDDDGEMYEEHEYVRRTYTVRPDGTAQETITIESPLGSGHVETHVRKFPAGTWLCDTWSHRPNEFGSRWGTCVVKATAEEKARDNTIYRKFKEIHWSTTPVAVAITRATSDGIQPYHALLALTMQIPYDPEWAVELLMQLAGMTRGTQLSYAHQHADGDASRYYLRAISSLELPYDRARGYCPVERQVHRIATETERCDLPEGAVLEWSRHEELR